MRDPPGDNPGSTATSLVSSRRRSGRDSRRSSRADTSAARKQIRFSPASQGEAASGRVRPRDIAEMGPGRHKLRPQEITRIPRATMLSQFALLDPVTQDITRYWVGFYRV